MAAVGSNEFTCFNTFFFIINFIHHSRITMHLLVRMVRYT